MDKAHYDDGKVTKVASIDDHWHEVFSIPRLNLPRAVWFPEKATPFSTRLRLTRFVSPYMKPQTHEEHMAVFRWIAGHHILFLFWGGIAEACHQTTQAIRQSRMDEAELWLERARLLVDGDIAAMVYSADFRLLQYQNLIRPGMEKCRQDFAAGMSPESRLMAQAIRDMDVACDTAASQLSAEFQAVLSGFRLARKHWGQIHIRVAMSLQPDDETLRIKLEEFARNADNALPLAGPDQCPVAHKTTMGVSLLKQNQKRQEAETGVLIDRREYDKNVLGAPEVAAAYDAYFGVNRPEQISAEDILAAVYRTMELVILDLADSKLAQEERMQIFLASDVLISMLREKIAAEPLASTG